MRHVGVIPASSVGVGVPRTVARAFLALAIRPRSRGNVAQLAIRNARLKG